MRERKEKKKKEKKRQTQSNRITSEQRQNAMQIAFFLYFACRKMYGASVIFKRNKTHVPAWRKKIKWINRKNSHRNKEQDKHLMNVKYWGVWAKKKNMNDKESDNCINKICFTLKVCMCMSTPICQVLQLSVFILCTDESNHTQNAHFLTYYCISN